MKKLFWFGVLGLLLFEIANVYFIMPIPGSQQMNSIDLAYFLYRWRWAFRIIFLLMLLVALFRSHVKKKWLLLIPIAVLLVVVYMANFQMAADHMFYQAKKVLMVNAAENKVDSGRLVIGVKINDEAKAYPIRFFTTPPPRSASINPANISSTAAHNTLSVSSVLRIQRLKWRVLNIRLINLMCH